MFGFGVFGFDPKAMSDEELMHKQVELQGKLVWAGRFGGSDTITRLQELIYAIEFERQERAFGYMWKQQQAIFPDVIETDPDLAKQHQKEVEDADRPKVAQQNRPRVVITRTDRPTPEKEG